MNRNPHKRLGAGKTGSDSIKAHPFFKDINWNDCMDRKLTVLPPLLKEIAPANISDKVFKEEEELTADQGVDGWTFILPE
mmetsp:Transcript_14386/g.12669  ORF Transcript_14386/g.12669 Transcript_14386/m.12669 type:complete len:80 (+) Transcript_14386:359-598(+)